MSREEFDRLVVTSQSDLYHFALALCGNEADALDLVQDAVIKMLKNYKRFEMGTNFKAWAFRIIRNTFIDLTRRNKFRSTIEIEDESIQDDVEVKSKDFKDVLSDEILKAFNKLDSQSRAILVLSDIQGFSYKEISETLDVPIGTCMSRLFRARRKLQSLIIESRANLSK